MAPPRNAKDPADYNFVPEVQPSRITNGGIAVITAEVTVENDGTYEAAWIVEGPVPLSDEDSRIALLGATTVTGGLVELSSDPTTIRATLDTGPLSVGAWRVGLVLTEVVEGESEDEPNVLSGISEPFEVRQRPLAAGDEVAVTLRRASAPPTSDQALWVAIRSATNALGFHNYSRFIEAVMCDRPDEAFGLERRAFGHTLRKVKRRTALPFPNVDRYRLLKAATEVFMMTTHCGVDLGDFRHVDLDEESRRLESARGPG